MILWKEMPNFYLNIYKYKTLDYKLWDAYHICPLEALRFQWQEDTDLSLFFPLEFVYIGDISLYLSRVGEEDALLLCEPQILNFEAAFLYGKTPLCTCRSAHLALITLPQKKERIGLKGSDGVLALSINNLPWSRNA